MRLDQFHIHFVRFIYKNWPQSLHNCVSVFPLIQVIIKASSDNGPTPNNEQSITWSKYDPVTPNCEMQPELNNVIKIYSNHKAGYDCLIYKYGFVRVNRNEGEDFVPTEYLYISYVPCDSCINHGWQKRLSSNDKIKRIHSWTQSLTVLC